ncbi:MAG: hypothetical protein KDH88_17550 [Chromatiales bacterium]|nr:hypothetical protein [Chromatiales bacterium]
MNSKKVSGIRNPVARSPLLRKGGTHERSRSGERQSEQRRLERELARWHPDKRDPQT